MHNRRWVRLALVLVLMGGGGGVWASDIFSGVAPAGTCLAVAGGVVNTVLTDNGSGCPQDAGASSFIQALTASGVLGMNGSGGTLLTQPSNTTIFSFNGNSRVVSGSIANPGFFSAARWDGTVGSPTAVQAGDQLGGFNSWAYNGTALAGPYGTFRCYANQNQAVGSGGTYCDIGTTANGGTTLTEAIRFENDQGITVPSTVTGGDKGAGTINAGGLYVNGVAVPAATSSYVKSFTGDGTLINNSASTGAVTVTLANATAYSLWGNNTSSAAAPGYTVNPIVSGKYPSSQTGLGTTTAVGSYLQNTTLSTSGTKVQVSPALEFEGMSITRHRGMWIISRGRYFTTCLSPEQVLVGYGIFRKVSIPGRRASRM